MPKCHNSGMRSYMRPISVQNPFVVFLNPALFAVDYNHRRLPVHI